MLKVSSSLPDIAVLRGGHSYFKESLKEGGDVLTSLKKIGYQPLDVLIEKDGTWNTSGTPTDAHTIFSRAHTIIDTTKLEGEQYHELAKKMRVHIHFANTHDISFDREVIYRLLRQAGIKVPNTHIVRATFPLKNSIFRELWTTYHTPLLIRPLTKSSKASSKIITVFSELEKVVREYHSQGIDLHILTYRSKTPITSVAVLPNFRDEEVYIPLWVDTFPEDGGLPYAESQMRPHLQAPDFRKEHIKNFVTKVYKAIGVTTPVCIDFINNNNMFTVVNVDLNPSLRKEGRFMRSLATTGIDVGQYIHGCIHNDLKR